MAPPPSKFDNDGRLLPIYYLEVCEEAIKTFNPVVTTVDSHSEEFLNERKIKAQEDRLFISQVLYGCMRYKKMLKVMLSSFYFNNAAVTSREDFTKYLILSYLLLIRLDELGLSSFKKIAGVMEEHKVHVLLTYLYNEHNLTKWIKDEWLKIYDVRYTEDVLIGGIMRRLPEMTMFINDLYDRIMCRKQEEEEEEVVGERQKKFTTPTPFNLTRPKPRMVPHPEKIVNRFEAKEVPDTQYTKRTKTDLRIEAKKDENRRLIQEKYGNPKVQPFKLKTAERPSNLEKVREEVERERTKELKFNMKYANPIPKPPDENANVKMNMAAVLREEALYKKKQKEEAAIIKKYEAELRDPSEYYSWQEEMRKKDEKIHKDEIEARKTALKLAQEEARRAAEQKILEKNVIAASMQQETDLLLAKRELEAKEELMLKMEKVEEVRDIQQYVEIAKKDVEAKKIENAQKLKQESEELKRQKAEEEAEEQKRREEIIRQIRALERVPKAKVTIFDPTTVKGHGLLEEMSLAELGERLQQARRRDEEVREEKRQEIIQNKQKKEQEMYEKVDKISRIRDLSAQDAKSQRERKRREEEERVRMEKEIRDKNNIVLNAKVQEIRKQRVEQEEKLKAELKAIKLHRQFLAADKEQVEFNKWKEQENGAQREMGYRQKTKQIEQAIMEKTKQREAKVRAQNKAKVSKETKEMRSAVDKKAKADKEAADKLTALKKAAKLEVVKSEKARYETFTKKASAVNPYAKQITDEVKATAKTYYATKVGSTIRPLGDTTKAPNPTRKASSHKGLAISTQRQHELEAQLAPSQYEPTPREEIREEVEAA